MMYIPTLIAPLLLLPLPLASAIDILLPLYLYPGDAATAWSPIFQTISTHPTTTFQIVINPNSGPGTPSTLTDPNLITGISKLNAYPNVRTLGYVLTGYGQRANTAVTADVDIYAGWSASSPDDADIHLDGIYFDEVSNDKTQANYDRMASFSQHARESISGATVVFNPGYRAPEPLFASCDLMVEFEHPLADYEAEGVLAQIPPAFAGKSAVQILETPVAGTDVAGLVAAMEQTGLGAVFFGADCCYKVFGDGLLEAMADAAAA